MQTDSVEKAAGVGAIGLWAIYIRKTSKRIR